MTPAQKQAAYDLLGVSQGSDAVTVKAAWRKMVRTYHPDQARQDPVAASRKLAEINAAFDLLSTLVENPAPRREKPRHSAQPKPQTKPQPSATARPAQTPTPGTALRTMQPRVQTNDIVPQQRQHARGMGPLNFSNARNAQQAFKAARSIYDAPAATAKQVAYC